MKPCIGLQQNTVTTIFQEKLDWFIENISKIEKLSKGKTVQDYDIFINLSQGKYMHGV